MIIIMSPGETSAVFPQALQLLGLAEAGTSEAKHCCCRDVSMSAAASRVAKFFFPKRFGVWGRGLSHACVEKTNFMGNFMIFY